MIKNKYEEILAQYDTAKYIPKCNCIDKIIKGLDDAIAVMRNGKEYNAQYGWLYTVHFFEQLKTELEAERGGD